MVFRVRVRVRVRVWVRVLGLGLGLDHSRVLARCASGLDPTVLSLGGYARRIFRVWLWGTFYLYLIQTE